MRRLERLIEERREQSRLVEFGIEPGVSAKVPKPQLPTAHHDRCPTGSHWNDNKNKCMELPPDLKKQIGQSIKHTQTADRASQLAKSAGGGRYTVKKAQLAQRLHRNAGDAHSFASFNHDETARSLKWQGFNQLAKKHKAAVTAHARKGLQHFDQGGHIAHGFGESRQNRARLEAILRESVEESTAHVRCSPGKHWNDKKHRCVPLTWTELQKIEDLKAKHPKTPKSERDFGATPHDGRSIFARRAAEDHAQAALAHGAFADEMKGKGFSALATRHASRASEHKSKASFFQSKIPSFGAD